MTETGRSTRSTSCSLKYGITKFPKYILRYIYTPAPFLPHQEFFLCSVSMQLKMYCIVYWKVFLWISTCSFVLWTRRITAHKRNNLFPMWREWKNIPIYECYTLLCDYNLSFLRKEKKKSFNVVPKLWNLWSYNCRQKYIGWKNLIYPSVIWHIVMESLGI